MLHAMEQTTASAPSSPSFAGLLAALASPAQKSGVPGDRSSSAGWKSGVPGDRSLSAGCKPTPAWSDDGLEDDIATLSYERALRAHARYRAIGITGPTGPTDRALTQAADLGPTCPEEAPLAEVAAASQSAARLDENGLSAATPATAATLYPDRDRPWAAHFQGKLKDASITIRMSKAECAQLHRRAAEAGLTVSAYLRSCTFEAESLRAMVKDTLAQLRSATTQASPAPPRRSRFRGLAAWLAHLLTPWHGSQRVARA
jgi:hypothetical protein